MEETKPNRSDVRLNAAEAAKIEAETRGYFDDLAPKRHIKPQRSEYSSAYKDALSSDDSDGLVIPEYVQFQHLEKDDTQKLVYTGGEVTEEFTETEYYSDLNGADKQHHTTGTGFIKVESMKLGNGFSLAQDSSSTEHHESCRGNPATNDWIPSPAAAGGDNMVDFISGKPKRSEWLVVGP